MKPFNTLSNLELINLDDNQIKEHLDYICAEEGLPLEIVEPDRPEPITNNGADLFLVEIASVVVDRATGGKLMEIIDAAVEYKNDYGSTLYKPVKKGEYGSAEAKLVNAVSAQKKAQQAADNYSLTVQWKEYNEAMKLFDDAVSARQEKIEGIYDQISSARSQAYNQERMNEEWDRYLVLAKNDRDVAEKFFVDRYSQQQFNDLFSQEKTA